MCCVSHGGHFPSDTNGRTVLATMRPAVPPEVALMAFLEKHRRCGELEDGVEDRGPAGVRSPAARMGL